MNTIPLLQTKTTLDSWIAVPWEEFVNIADPQTPPSLKAITTREE